MGAGKNKSHRKKRISKHVLQAEERKKQTEVEKQLLSAAENGTAATPSALPTTATSSEGAGAAEKGSLTQITQPSSSSSKTKDPEEASSYLVLWNYDRANNTKQWKFNKNTQSWLLRHMYDFDKVSKATFTLLVEYLCRGGDRARSRVEEDAKARARRYKEWEKRGQKQEGEAEGGGDQRTNVDGGEKDDDAESKNKVEKQSPSSEGASWNDLDDHDKRKEYKRTRKVLDSLKAARDGKAEA